MTSSTKFKGAANALLTETSNDLGYVDYAPATGPTDRHGPPAISENGKPGDALRPLPPIFNHKPTSTDDEVATAEDTATVLGLDDFGSYADADGQPLMAVRITTLASNGALQYDVSGTGK
jgi:hypothetical protein